MALEHAGLTADILREMEPISLVMGICSGAVDLTEQAKETVMTRGAKRVRPHIVGSCQPHAIGAALVQMLGVQTSVTTISAACPSGLDAVAAASKMIKEGRTDMVVVGAADSPLNISTAASFCAAGIPPISTNFPAEEISRPFDAKSEGGPMSEGAGFVILERLDSALARGATLYGEVLSGATITDPPGKGSLEGLSQTMEMALSNAGILPDQISYICANAIGNLTGDRMETKLIKKVFKSAAYQIPISSIKGVTGNPLAAAGIFQVITCILSMTRGMIPPTANLTNPDPQCDLDYVPLKPRSIKVTYALANMHGMGGENSTLIVKRV
jgi:3-oxoacyl-[acyl-carrier-protein] synthase II